jgi:hypothetical protein
VGRVRTRGNRGAPVPGRCSGSGATPSEITVLTFLIEFTGVRNCGCGAVALVVFLLIIPAGVNIWLPMATAEPSIRSAPPKDFPEPVLVIWQSLSKSVSLALSRATAWWSGFRTSDPMNTSMSC